MPISYIRKKNVDTVEELDNIHYVAEQFLKNPWATGANEYVTGTTLEDASLYRIERDVMPEFFVGRKSNGTIVWSHDKKLAKVLPSADAEVWLASLREGGFTVGLKPL